MCPAPKALVVVVLLLAVLSPRCPAEDVPFQDRLGGPGHGAQPGWPVRETPTQEVLLPFAADAVAASARTATLSADGRFLARVEGTKLMFNRKPAARVERDAAGHVVRLRLDGLRLSPEDFQAVGRLTRLRSLSLCRTNTTDADLRHLRGLVSLESLNLTSTGVTDAAVAEIAGLAALRTLCLGDVAVRPESVSRLKARFPRLSLGYSRRRP